MQAPQSREYRAYWQGPQRGSGAHGELPKGASRGARGETPRMWIGACGGVAPLGNGAHHSLRGRATATLAWRGHQTPWDALKRQNSRDTTLGPLMLRLFLRFAGLVRADGDASVAELDWLVWDDVGSTTAQGRTQAAGLESVVADHAPWADAPARVVVFVPTADIVALRCDVPGRTTAQLRRAARYAVEPFITEDIDTMHVAYGALARHEAVRCLVTPRHVMQQWLRNA